MATKVTACDVRYALQRAKHKIWSLENELSVKECYSESEEELSQSGWTHSKELKESLVDMYKANPKVNEELRQRLPSPVRHQSSTETAPQQLGHSDVAATTTNQTGAEVSDKDWPQVPQHLMPIEERSSRTSRTPSPQSPRVPEAGLVPGRRMGEERPPSQSFFTGEISVQTTDGSPVYRRHVVPPEASQAPHSTSLLEDPGNSQVSRKTSPVLDKDKNIGFLLKELDSLRELNQRLQDKLALREKELETRLIDAELQDTEMEARACEKAGALVEEIYKAQRERDQAVMARLRLANEERDEALLRAKRLQQAAEELENINPEESDADLEELLNRVNSADSALGIERSGAVIVDRLQKARERRRKITAEEMNAVIEERDAALAKSKRLEQELLTGREQTQTSANNASRHLTAENNQERARKEELEAVQRERDRALEHSQHLEEEMQALRTYHSLHQSQCEEVSQNHQRSSTPTQASLTPQPREGPSPLGFPPQQQPLLAQLQQLASEHQSTQHQLQRTQEAEREANEKVQKLERLVEVLRKKVGTGSVRQVI